MPLAIPGPIDDAAQQIEEPQQKSGNRLMDYNPQNVFLLIADDDDEYRSTVVRRCRRRGFQVREARDGLEAIEQLRSHQFDVVILDMMMPKATGLEVLEQTCKQPSEYEVIMLTGQGTIEAAVKAMKLGAYDFLTKPFPLSELEILIQKAFERKQLGQENERLKTLLEHTEPEWQMVGQSPAMRKVYRLIERVGPSDKSVLIQGESGTGKELVARALHRHSPRADKPLVVVNSASFSETLLESELFGHEKGAFTGAAQAKPGLFEVADGSTLFIDEIGEMPPPMQAKLLRVLEDGSLRRVGSLKERRVNVRLLSATNRDISNEVAEGRFREDLFYRINLMTIELPPLRDRRGDIALLVDVLLKPDWQIEDDALRCVETYSWPGNVRQLINVIERAKLLARGDIIRIDDLPDQLLEGKAPPRSPGINPTDKLCDVQRAKVIEVLSREGGNKTRAARRLGLTRRSLYRLLEKYEIAESDIVVDDRPADER